MSHDTDKLIRQLSLVAFLMAERRPLTARDIKSSVEGYSEMSDEAFARRFYSDRAELIGLGVPLHSQRDEFTGEELYTLRSERYFLPELKLEEDELAALQTALYLLEGRFAYAEPLRLALQNLALGRPGFGEAGTQTEERVQVRDPDYTPEMQGRLAKLENAISKQRTVKFRYWSIYKDEEEERTLNPYALLPENGSWYVIGQDLDREDIRTFRVSRIRSDIRFATRRERDFRLPEEFPIERYRGRAKWQFGDARRRGADPRRARHRVVGRARLRPPRPARGRRLRHELREPAAARRVDPQAGGPRACRSSRPSCARSSSTGCAAARAAHERKPRQAARRDARREADGVVPERTASPVAPERFAILQSLLAYLLAACGEDKEAVIPARDLVEKFRIPEGELEEHLSLLNLVNFGGGCYAVYAELHGDEVHVDKELFGDAFRRPPRLTPLEARAIRLALEFVGPMIAAGAHSPLERVRRKLEETFGEFELQMTPEPDDGPRGGAARDAERGDRGQPPRRDRLPEGGRADAVDAAGRAVPHLARAAALVRAHVEPHERRPSAASASTGSAPCACSTRPSSRATDFEPQPFRGARTRARLVLARGRALGGREGRAAGSPTARRSSERAVGSPEWLVGEILSFRGEAEVLEPRRPARARRRRAPPSSSASSAAPAPPRRLDVSRRAAAA